MPLRGTTAGENVVAAPRFREYSPPGRGKRRQALGWVVARKQYPPGRSATAVATVKASQAFTPSRGFSTGQRFTCKIQVVTSSSSSRSEARESAGALGGLLRPEGIDTRGVESVWLPADAGVGADRSHLRSNPCFTGAACPAPDATTGRGRC